jgi:hypothetical protein
MGRSSPERSPSSPSEGTRPRRWVGGAIRALALLLLAFPLLAAAGPMGLATAAPPASVAHLSPAQTAPTAPTGVVATPHNEAVNVTWQAPSSDGGAPITSYQVDWSPAGNTGNSTTVGSTDHAWVSGLTNGLTYDFRVAARNIAGTGPFSSPAVPAVPGLPPLAPQNVSVLWGNESARVNWTAPTPRAGYPAQSYVVNLTSPSAFALTRTTALNVSLTGLTDGTRYRVAVEAQNALGLGANSSAVFFTPFGPPGAPTNLTAVPGPARTELTVSWVAPGWTGAAPIENFTIRWSGPGGAEGVAHANASATSWALWGVVAGGTYTVQVAAGGKGGTGPYAATTLVVTFSTSSSPSPLSPEVVLLAFSGLVAGFAALFLLSGRSSRRRRAQEARRRRGGGPPRPLIVAHPRDFVAPSPQELDPRHLQEVPPGPPGPPAGDPRR